MENFALRQVNNAISKIVHVNAIKTNKIIGNKINKLSRFIHSTPKMTCKDATVTPKLTSFTIKLQSKMNHAIQTPTINDNAAMKSDIGVESWIKKHYTPYEGDSFLSNFENN
ncbi:hypothetical protein BCR32DRAFT_227575 [Anaeromyces robustus]|uniref:Uncharacterized protein n=1 Tax=Anaeromyces robustus TaxID=1754192 RepID=A0A1Y1XQK4_9FUNG|nr:hypothetical protein BCR32DRAFT_227575 [Anaeromyces robustus]|eukprot:ORX88007.1 hypothetical protein BCR32DRAFT_227575 [Anaeromyces robustus]